MKSISYIAHNIQIRKKLILSYLFVVFIPVLSVGLLLSNSLKKITIGHAIQQSVNNAEKIKKRTEELLRIPTDISNQIYFDNKIKSLVSNNYSSVWDVVHAYKDYNDFDAFLKLYKEIAGIRLYTGNDTLLNNWTLFKVDQATRNSEWYTDGLRNRGKIEWFYIPDVTHQNMRYLSLVREIFFDNMTFCGMLIVTVNPEYLLDAVSQEPFETLIVTGDENIIAAKDFSLVGKTLSDIDLTGFGAKTSTDIVDSKYKGKDAKIILKNVTTDNSKNQFRIISIIPTETITAEVRKVNVIAFLIIFVSLLVSIGMIFFFSNVLSKRIGILSRHIRRVALGDFSSTSVVEGKDEIGQLARHFNFMVRNIELLMSEVEEAHLQKNTLVIKQKEIKFKMLANQVNPHFLFNVLETIRMKAHTNGENEIANTVKSLGQLLRHNLEMGQEPVSLADEIVVVRKYLEIQRFRFGDKIDYELPPPEEAYDCIILPMILQPVVENAIIHGLENKLGKGTVTVRLEKWRNHLRLIVSDDGTGIEIDKLQQLMRSLNEPDDESNHHIGLRNVHQRLQLYYGSEFGLAIESELREGTKVTILFPDNGGTSHV
ncbi:sensor histidine kinase [Paenibacillus alginolyticus]|uniref:sensor histidine kinase n=1 Tax=Paenibacillus alginolyticus TaxID=59839 RepID=UPI0004215955|nr:sensor histidine kinase [Paenibacillus alginolyticus]MCY9667278.1 sensor histidine kinase [Paenibacillus alginolyticus]